MSLTTTEIQQYIRLTLRQHGLADHSVLFLPRLTNRLGQANPWKKRIELSPRCLSSFAVFKWTFLHELSHILQFSMMGNTYQKNGRNNFHGQEFKKACAIVGVSSSRFVRCGTLLSMEEAKKLITD